MKVLSGTLAPGVFVAGIFAGPIFLFSAALSSAYLQLPRPISIGMAELLPFLAVLIPSIAFGALIGMPASAIGGGMMGLLGGHCAMARLRIAWAVVGFAIGMAIVWGAAFSEPSLSFGFVFTCTACAWLTSSWVEWDG